MDIVWHSMEALGLLVQRATLSVEACERVSVLRLVCAAIKHSIELGMPCHSRYAYGYALVANNQCAIVHYKLSIR
jgi:hypothetical protein